MTHETTINHINFLASLPKDFKEFLKRHFDLDCSTICFKQDGAGQMTPEAKMVMVAYKAWDIKEQEARLNLIRALTAEKINEAFSLPDCFWDDDDEDGLTYSNLEELFNSVKSSEKYTILNVGQSVQIDNSVMVLDHQDNSFVVVKNKAEAEKLISLRRLKDAAANRPFDLNSLVPAGAKRTPAKGKRKKGKVEKM